MIRNLFDTRLSIRQLFYLTIVVGVPYAVIGLIWALTHTDHLAAFTGVDRLFSLLGEIVAWPVLLIANVSLI